MKLTLLVAGAGAAAVVALAAGVTMVSSAPPAAPFTVTTAASVDTLPQQIVRTVTLRAMPQGSVVFGHDNDGTFTAQVSVTGLTPGSTHTVRVEVPGAYGVDHDLVPLGTLTADPQGAKNITLSGPVGSSAGAGLLPAGARLQILQGISGDFGNNEGNPLQREVIAQSVLLPPKSDHFRSPLTGVDFATNGVDQGKLAGFARIVYRPSTATVSVTVNASGFTPGAHAAHFHTGSCASQGGVVVMLPDLNADKHGRISETVTAKGAGALSALSAGGLYLNIHLGAMSQILANNAPTILFRPLLCGNV